MKLINARFCPDCEEIFDPTLNITEDRGSCPSCTNRNTVSLSIFFKEKRGENLTKEEWIRYLTEKFFEHKLFEYFGQSVFVIEMKRHRGEYSLVYLDKVFFTLSNGNVISF
jgi:hypothetical protein